MKLIKILVFLILAAFMLSACEREPLKPDQQSPIVPQIILDTDIASSTDDLFALQLLYRYASQGRCGLLGVPRH